MSPFDDPLAKAGNGGFLAKVFGIADELTRFKQYASEVRAAKGSPMMLTYILRVLREDCYNVFNHEFFDEGRANNELRYQHSCSLKERQNSTFILI